MIASDNSRWYESSGVMNELIHLKLVSEKAIDHCKDNF